MMNFFDFRNFLKRKVPEYSYLPFPEVEFKSFCLGRCVELHSWSLTRSLCDPKFLVFVSDDHHHSACVKVCCFDWKFWIWNHLELVGVWFYWKSLRVWFLKGSFGIGINVWVSLLDLNFLNYSSRVCMIVKQHGVICVRAGNSDWDCKHSWRLWGQ